LPPGAGGHALPRRFSFLAPTTAAHWMRTAKSALRLPASTLAAGPRGVSSRPLPKSTSPAGPNSRRGPAAAQALPKPPPPGVFDDPVCRRPPRPAQCCTQLLLAAIAADQRLRPGGQGPPPARPKGATWRDPERIAAVIGSRTADPPAPPRRHRANGRCHAAPPQGERFQAHRESVSSRISDREGESWSCWLCTAEAPPNPTPSS